MLLHVGHIEALFRYPVKSMAGEPIHAAELGWHGIEGDRRLALRRVNNHSGFPWLTASQFPELLLYAPYREQASSGEIPSHIRTPAGELLPVFGEELPTQIGGRCGTPVEMLHYRHGIFDDASLSIITPDTIAEITRLADVTSDVRRFRPNVVVRLLQPAAFQEDQWVGGTLCFGDGDNSPTVSVMMKDIRCSMVNLDPDTAKPDTEVLKAVVRANQNAAGAYATITRVGRLEVGQAVFVQVPD